MPTTETLLVVEDEPAILGLMTSVLRRAGYRVLEARNGQEALDAFDASVDLLLADMRLPYVSGRDLIHLLRQRRLTLKILCISGYPLNAPLNPDIAFLAKPFSRDELLKKVRAVLDGD